jgi:hypothetical protein
MIVVNSAAFTMVSPRRSHIDLIDRHDCHLDSPVLAREDGTVSA